MSLQRRLLEAQLRVMAKPRFARVSDPVVARRDFERAARWLLPRPRGLAHIRRADGLHQISVGPVRGDAAILYFHGGGFVAGSPETHAAMMGRLSALSGLPIVVPRYRLAPDHRLPTAQDDAMAAWRVLVESGVAPDRIILGGDSAGGGLALSLLSDLCLSGDRPGAAFAFSPWTDLTLGGPSLRDNAGADPLLPADRMADLLDFVLKAGQDRRDPRISPLFAAFPQCPPVRLDWSATEILRDDSRRMAARLRAFGTVVEAVEAPGGPHVWPIFGGVIPEARHTLAAVSGFVQSALAASSR